MDLATLAPITDVTCIGYGAHHLESLRLSRDVPIKRVCVEAVDTRSAAGSFERVSTVVGFPFGTLNQPEIDTAWAEGSHEIDFPLPIRMVIDQHLIRPGVYEMGREIHRWLKGFDFKFVPGRVIKVILHTDLIQQLHGQSAWYQVAKVAEAVKDVIDTRLRPKQIYMKTCTGYGPGKGDPEVVQILKKEGYLVKASGGIRTLDDVKAVLDAGADLLGVGAPAYLKWFS